MTGQIGGSFLLQYDRLQIPCPLRLLDQGIQFIRPLRRQQPIVDVHPGRPVFGLLFGHP